MNEYDLYNDLVTFDGDQWFPLTEFTEDSDLIGPGHQDMLSFAMSASAYMDYVGGVDYSFDPSIVHYQWAVLDDSGENFMVVAERVPGSVPVTVIRW